MKKYGLIINLEKKHSVEIAQKIIQFLNEKGAEVLLPPENIDVLNYQGEIFTVENYPDDMECILVLGGDGTLLNAARKYSSQNIPLLGINLGQLGFLTEMEPDNFFEGLNKLLSGQYYVEKRMMLQASVNRNGEILKNFTALNDVVVTKGAFARMVELEAYVASEYVATYPADGLIVSSPTGSTAYSLSAGGPIIAPELEAIIFTPICPHTLYARPIIIPPNEILQIIVRSGKSEVMLTIDGQHGFKLFKNDTISVTRSKYTTKLVRLKGRSFYSVLREKLRNGDR